MLKRSQVHDWSLHAVVPLEPGSNVEEFVRKMPKVELHVHIEGTLEPELMLQLAQRNKVPLPHGTVDEIRREYDFRDLQSFLDIYYEGVRVLIEEQDFYDLTWAYVERVARENVRHAEIFFDPQVHVNRGVEFETCISGIHQALRDAHARLGISSNVILCFLRELSAESAMRTLETALYFKEWIIGVGLDSAELRNPPRKFAKVFERARAEGFRGVAHAGEEGPAAYISEALDVLKVERIDHGVQCTADPKLVDRLARERVPLTVCPLSNVKLRVFDSLEKHNLKRLLDLGLRATVNSDDPAYFGGYITENFLDSQSALGLTRSDIQRLAANAIDASFLGENRKRELRRELHSAVEGEGAKSP